MSDNYEFKVAEPNGEDLEKVVAACEMMRSTLVMLFPDPKEHMTYGFTAAAMLAGVLYGAAIVAGIESGSSQRNKRAAKTVERNFHAGIKVAQKKAARMAQREGMVN